MPTPMSLKAFVKAVNRLSKNNCKELNKDKDALFKAVHIDLPESMLKIYYEEGKSPEDTFSEINVKSI